MVPSMVPEMSWPGSRRVPANTSRQARKNFPTELQLKLIRPLSPNLKRIVTRSGGKRERNCSECGEAGVDGGGEGGFVSFPDVACLQVADSTSPPMPRLPLRPALH